MRIRLFSGSQLTRVIKATIIWLSIYFLFGLLLSFFIDLGRASFISLIVILPLVPPVHLNNYFIDHLYLKGKYWQYFVILIVILVFFGYLAQLLMDIFHNIEGEYIGAMLNPFAVVLVTSGIKGFREFLQNNYRIAEARAKQAEAELKLAEAESKQVRAEIDLLKAQVNPHFLFNTLNGIYSMALDKSDNTCKAIMLLSKLMRYHLDTSKSIRVPLTEEIAFIQTYIELEKIRFDQRCIIHFNTEGVDDLHLVPPLLLLPLVENCFKHGISIERDKNIIDINISVDHNKLTFSTLNNIPGDRSEYPDDKKVKTGISNIMRRLELLYDRKHTFSFGVRGDKYFVNLIIEI